MEACVSGLTLTCAPSKNCTKVNCRHLYTNIATIPGQRNDLNCRLHKLRGKLNYNGGAATHCSIIDTSNAIASNRSSLRKPYSSSVESCSNEGCFSSVPIPR